VIFSKFFLFQSLSILKAYFSRLVIYSLVLQERICFCFTSWYAFLRISLNQAFIVYFFLGYFGLLMLRFDLVVAGFDLGIFCSYFNDLLRLPRIIWILIDCFSNSRFDYMFTFFYIIWHSINSLLLLKKKILRYSFIY
jgi:hypothetical protein